MIEEVYVNGVDVSCCEDYDEFENLVLCMSKKDGMSPYCIDNPNCSYKENERKKNDS